MKRVVCLCLLFSFLSVLAREIYWKQENELTGEPLHSTLVRSDINRHGVTITSGRFHFDYEKIPRWVSLMIPRVIYCACAFITVHHQLCMKRHILFLHLLSLSLSLHATESSKRVQRYELICEPEGFRLPARRWTTFFLLHGIRGAG